MRHAGGTLPRPTLRHAGLLALALAAAALPAHAGVNVWTPLGPDGGQIDALVAAPTQPGPLYATSFGGVFRSEDAGATWVRISGGDLAGYVTGVVADPVTPATVYAFGEFGLARSTDAAATWTVLPPLSQGDAITGSLALAIDPHSPATLYGGSQSGVWKSTDAGATWTRLSATARGVQTVAVDPANPSIVFAFAKLAGVLLRSADGGATWEEKDTGLSLPTISDSPLLLAFDPSTVPETLYLAVELDRRGFTWRSTDAGDSWQQVGPGGYPLAVGSGLVYAGAVKSLDGGATWTAATPAPGTPVVLAAAPGSPTTVFAATSDLGIWKSADSAASWRPASSSLGATNTLALAIDPVHPRILYTAVNNSVLGRGLLKTGSRGRQWRLIGPNWLTDYLVQIVVDPVTPSTLYAASPAGLAKSFDGGQSWTVLPTQAGPGPDCFGIDQLAIDPAHSETLYVVAARNDGACFPPCSFLKSTDGGNSWSCKSVPFDMRKLFVAPQAIYALSDFSNPGRLFKSTDAGVTWARVDAGLPTNNGLPSGYVTLAIDPTNASHVFVSGPRGVFRTSNGGRTWTKANGRLPAHSFHSNLAIDPHHPATVYASGSWGVYRTIDDGQSWSPIVGGLPLFAFESNDTPIAAGWLLVDPQQPGKIYGGTLYTGIYTYTAQ
ncbi:MAG TPA: hypothetical protein VN999_17720 [Thermoanaerobaculia bacterium]|nr:hypothetical protein [Thermoanaerobaculia bacterium]